MSAKPYPYAVGDLLEKPNTYFYAEYGGRDFLDCWKLQRQALMNDMAEAPPGRHYDGASTGDRIDTDALLDHVFAAIHDGRLHDPKVFQWLAQLVKKFEVTKRIHEAYGPGFRAIDPSRHKKTGRYLRLAEVFEAAYTAGGDLPFLNALLKALDTLSTLVERLNAIERARLARLVGREHDHVSALAATLGFSL